MDRRTFLASAGAAGIASFAGCSSLKNASANAKPPEISEKKLEDGGWEKIADREETVLEKSYQGVTFSAEASAVVYEDKDLRQRIYEESLQQVDTPLSILFATRIDFSHDIDELPIAQDQILSQVRKNAQGNFENRLENAGLTDITQTGTSELTVNTGETADVVEMEATYTYEGSSIQLPNGEPMEFEGRDLTIEAFLATWQHGDFTLVAGAAYPGENFTISEQKEPSEAIDISYNIDLRLTPDEYEQEATEIVKTIS